MFHIDPSDPTPVEAQLVRTIRSAVGAGALAAGDALPTVRQLSVDLRVGANAVARAYEELERQGVLATRAGVGTTTAPPSAGPRRRASATSSAAPRWPSCSRAACTWRRSCRRSSTSAPPPGASPCTRWRCATW